MHGLLAGRVVTLASRAVPDVRPARVAVVTGGASGIGEATCRRLAD
jgi:NADP-dependent 3-hydroxy acid dehydrogenase YdfG